MKMTVHVAIADAIENDHKSIMILTFALFSGSVFPTTLEPRGTGLFLDLKEFWLSYRKKPSTSQPLISLQRPLSHLKRRFSRLPCPNRARYNFLLRWSWNCQNTEHRFLPIFYSFKRGSIVVIETMN